MDITYVLPGDIERRSFEMITEILGERTIDPAHAHIIKRCIHTSADFDYSESLYFSPGSVASMTAALENGCTVITDTQMVKAGINAKAAGQLGVSVHCFIGDADVEEKAKASGSTRAAAAIEKASELHLPAIFAVGNAPTALIRLYELIKDGYCPIGIIAVPVGFVNVVESKELIVFSGIPCIAAMGRKGGSNIAAAIVNAMLYSIVKR